METPLTAVYRYAVVFVTVRQVRILNTYLTVTPRSLFCYDYGKFSI